MIYNFVAEQTDAHLDFDITLEQKKNVYCFIGENAVGKTNLLENMARTLLYCHSMFKEKKQDNLKYAGVYHQKIIHDDIKDFYLQLALNIFLNQKRVKDKQNDNWGFTTFERLASKPLVFKFDKPLVFIGAQNRGYTKNIDKNHIKILGNWADRFVETLTSAWRHKYPAPLLSS